MPFLYLFALLLLLPCLLFAPASSKIPPTAFTRTVSPALSTSFPENDLPKKKFKTVLGKKMAYVEVGKGDPIVFLHGNPTSSYLWRNIMPHLEGRGRLLAPDLIGMGDSEKIDNSGPGSYTILEHSAYLFTLLNDLNVKERVTFVLHDWGSFLGFYWAFQNQESVKAIVFMESIVTPFPTYDEFPEGARAVIRRLRSPEGEKLVLEDNFFVETLMPHAILRNLSAEEKAEYRRPYLERGEGRRTMLTMPRQIPIAGKPTDITAISAAYGKWLSSSHYLPKLFINADPGLILTGFPREFVRTWSNLDEVTVKGLHYIQEDSPNAIGRAIADWLTALHQYSDAEEYQESSYRGPARFEFSTRMPAAKPNP